MNTRKEDIQYTPVQVPFTAKKISRMVAICTFSLLHCPAWAQEGDANADDENVIEEVIVTGTNIRGISPVGSEAITIDQDAMRATGGATVADVVRTLPQIQRGGSNGGQSFTSVSSSSTGAIDIQGNAARGDAINLRGLGQDATLLLVNGRRVSTSGTSRTFSDAVQVPLSALERVEVIADGASAIYGSDAIAGVVNYILKDDYQGLEINGAVGSNGLWEFGAIGGTSWSSLGGFGAGNIIFSASLMQEDSILRADLPRYALDQRPYGGNNNLIQEDVAFPGAAGNILIQRADANPDIPSAGNYDYYALPQGSNESLTFADIAGSLNQPNLTDRGLWEDYRGDVEREQFSLSLNQELGRFDFYADARYSKRDTITRTYFGGGQNDGPETVTIPRFLPDGVTPHPYWFDTGSGGPLTVQYNLQAHLPEGLGFSNDTFDEQYAFTAGLTFDVGNDWEADLAVTYTDAENCGFCYLGTYVDSGNATLEGIPATNAFVNAVNNGDINPLSSEPLTMEQFNLFKGDNIQRSQTDGTTLTARFNGPLFSLPAGDLLAAVGAEYFETTHALQNGANRPPANEFIWDADSSMTREISSVYAELYVPLMDTLSMSLAARHDDYSDFGTTTNPRIGFTWDISDELSLRSSWSTSFRAPDLARLQSGVFSLALIGLPQGFGAQSLGLTDAIPFIPGNQAQSLLILGGNEALQPEEGENFSYGFTWRPHWLEGLDISASYYKVEYDNRLGTLPTDSFLANDANAAVYADFHQIITPPAFGTCSEADRSTYDPAVRAAIDATLYKASIFGACGVTVILDGRTHNTAASLQEGVDLQLSYTFTTELGSFNLGANLNEILESEFKANPTAPKVSDLDTQSGPVSTRFRGSLGWFQGPWSANLFMNHIGGYTLTIPFSTDSGTLNEQSISSWDTYDLNINYNFDDSGFDSDWLRGTRITFNINNFTDEDPPVVLTESGSVGPLHDPLGRIYRLSFTKAL